MRLKGSGRSGRELDDRTIGALQRSVKGGIEGYIEDRLALGDSTDCLFSVCSISHTSRGISGGMLGPHQPPCREVVWAQHGFKKAVQI
jgi:hypothetical protein